MNLNRNVNIDRLMSGIISAAFWQLRVYRVLHYFHALCFFQRILFLFLKVDFYLLRTHCLFLGCLHYSWIVVHVMLCVINIKWNIELCRLLPLGITPLRDSRLFSTKSQMLWSWIYLPMVTRTILLKSELLGIRSYVYISIQSKKTLCGEDCVP